MDDMTMINLLYQVIFTPLVVTMASLTAFTTVVILIVSVLKMFSPID